LYLEQIPLHVILFAYFIEITTI